MQALVSPTPQQQADSLRQKIKQAKARLARLPSSMRQALVQDAEYRNLCAWHQHAKHSAQNAQHKAEHSAQNAQHRADAADALTWAVQVVDKMAALEQKNREAIWEQQAIERKRIETFEKDLEALYEPNRIQSKEVALKKALMQAFCYVAVS